MSYFGPNGTPLADEDKIVVEPKGTETFACPLGGCDWLRTVHPELPDDHPELVLFDVPAEQLAGLRYAEVEADIRQHIYHDHSAFEYLTQIRRLSTELAEVRVKAGEAIDATIKAQAALLGIEPGDRYVVQALVELLGGAVELTDRDMRVARRMVVTRLEMTRALRLEVEPS